MIITILTNYCILTSFLKSVQKHNNSYAYKLISHIHRPSHPSYTTVCCAYIIVLICCHIKAT